MFTSKPFRTGLLFLSLMTAAAQDTRQVREPVIPRSCIVLPAKLSSIGGLKLREADESKLDTQRIQQAIEQCPQTQAVELKADGEHDAFLSGPLELRTGRTLLIDKGVVLFGSRNPRDYDISPGVCGTLTEGGHGCKAIINGDHAEHAAVMGEGVIDGRGGEKILGKNFSWWDLAEQARHTNNKNQNCPRIMILSHCNDFTLYRVTLRNSPNFHVYYGQGNGFTAWGVIINTPKTARNTDGIDPGSSTNVTITHCYIHAGDDQVAIKAGETGPSTNMTIAHNHFYTGHGVSIGSETVGGASKIRVSDLTIDGADNGIRIKSNSSRGGHVDDITYDNVCIRNTKNPILMDSNYSFYGKARDKLPLFTGITLRDIHIFGGGKITLDGYDARRRLQMNFDDVVVNGAAPQVNAKYADIRLGPGPVNFRIEGPEVHVTGQPAQKAANNSCEGRFVAMPQE